MLNGDPDIRHDFISLDQYITQNILTNGKRVVDFIKPGHYKIIPKSLV